MAEALPWLIGLGLLAAGLLALLLPVYLDGRRR